VPSRPDLFSLRSVRELMLQFQRPFSGGGSTLELGSTIRLLEMMRKELLKSNVGIELDIPEGSSLTVVGDLHGQLFDLLKIFTFNGEPSATNLYLFDGDFVDRGKHGAEVFLTLSAWKVLYPDFVHLLRGNHEVSTINEYYGFEEECRQKYPNDASMRSRFNAVFATLPVWAIIEKKIFVVHGGLPKQAERTSKGQLMELKKLNEPNQESQLQDLLWSDPQEPDGYEMSERGAGVMWGPDITDHFIANNGLDMVIRAHQMCADGYKMQHKGKVLTVFSSPNYCGRCGNRAAIVRIQSDRSMAIHTFVAANSTAAEIRAQETSGAVHIPLSHAVGSLLTHSPDNPFFVSDEEVEVQPRLRGHAMAAGASDVCYNSDGSMLASVSSKDGTLQLWQVSAHNSFENVVSLLLSSKPAKLCWHHDTIAIGFLNGVVQIFSTQQLLSTGALIQTFQHQIQQLEHWFATEFFPMQNEYDTADDARKKDLNSKFVLLQAERKQRQIELKAQVAQATTQASDVPEYCTHTDAIHEMRWNKDGSLLASCSRDRTLVLWSAQAADAVCIVPIATVLCPVPLAGLAWRGSEAVLACATGADAKVRVFDFSGARSVAQDYEIFSLSMASSLPVYAVSYNSDGTLLAVAGKDEAILLYDPEYHLIQRLNGAHSSGVTTLAFSPDDAVLASAGLDNCLRLWSVPEALQLENDLSTLRDMMSKVESESTATENESWRMQMSLLKRAVQKALLLGLSDRPHAISWKPNAVGALYSLAAAADGDMCVGVWDFPGLNKIAKL